MQKKGTVFLLVFFLAVSMGFTEPGRWEMDISGGDWSLWLDCDAKWVDDELFPPPVDIASLPVNPPTCGWNVLHGGAGAPAEVPGTVEQYYWSANGNPVGRAGDYRGVSWWSRTFTLDSSLRGKRILLAFECVNLRAEVYVNGQLVGYDIVGNTPFEADATNVVNFDGVNRLDVRVTDPGGNFSWPAHIVFMWGKHTIPIVRGFSGITGGVRILAIDRVRVEDVYVLNTPKITEADVHVAIGNLTGSTVDGTVTLKIQDYYDPSTVIWEKTVDASVAADGTGLSLTVKAPKAKLWGILEPNLYNASVTFESADGSVRDTMTRRFGFRWFYVGEKDGDQRFYLNGKRVFIMANVHRGYWPTNGIFPTEETVKKDIETAIDMGFNAIAYHNAIGHPLLVKYADEYGLLATGESAGYRINGSDGKPVPDALTRDLRRDKLFMFVKRDRSSPSIIAYMLKNEDGNAPDDDDMANIARVRAMDPTRTLLYTGDCDRAREWHAGLPKNPLKLFYKPNDDTEYWYGWFDKHHWNRYAGVHGRLVLP